MRSVRKSNMSLHPPLIQVDISRRNKISLFMHEFVLKVTDIVGDGHCGFRIMAGLYYMIVDDYQIIRLKLLKELVGGDHERYLRLIEKKNASTRSNTL